MRILFLLFTLPLLGLPTNAKGEEEYILNSTQTPDDVGAFYLDDEFNSGDLSGLPRERIALMDHGPSAIQVGEVGNENVSERIRKVFLLFRLPDLQGKSVKQAHLNLRSGNVHQEGPAPLPALFLLHAKQWDADLWDSDPLRRGLQVSDFGDVENFSRRKDVCGPGLPPGEHVSIDVTDLIRSNYESGPQPVAAFRLEIGDPQSLDMTDDRYNFYVFVGPGQFSMANGDPMPESSRPSLTLIAE